MTESYCVGVNWVPESGRPFEFALIGHRPRPFSPTYKFVTDMAEDCIHSTMAGGPSDRRFSAGTRRACPTGWPGATGPCIR